MDEVGVVLLELSGVVAVVPLAMARLDLLAVWSYKTLLPPHVGTMFFVVGSRGVSMVCALVPRKRDSSETGEVLL